MVTIGYETNVLGFKGLRYPSSMKDLISVLGPRKMTVAIPGMDLDGERVECQPHNGKIFRILRVVKTKPISFLKSLSEKVGSDLERL